MTTIPAPVKTAPVVITLTITSAAPENPSVGDLARIIASAEEVRASAAKFGAVTGTLTIGKQKYKLEEKSA